MTRLKHFNSVQDKIIMFIISVVLWVSVILILIPIVFIIASSFSSADAIASGLVYFWPVNFTLLGYKTILSSDYIIKGFMNTCIYTFLGTLVSVIFTILAAYPLSRKDIVGRNFLMFLFAFTMLFNGGMIPTYLVVRQLGMINTVWAMVLPNALSVWNVIITRTYFQSTIPVDLYESASLDGCRDYKFVLKIVMPLSKPIIAVNVLLYAVGQWNSYFPALLYLDNPDMRPLQIVLRDILISGLNMPNLTDVKAVVDQQYLKNLLQFSLIIVSSLPVMLLYPFIQKYFVKGIMIGAIKG